MTNVEPLPVYPDGERRTSQVVYSPPVPSTRGIRSFLRAGTHVATPPRIVAVIAAVGWLAVIPLRAAEDQGNDRRPPSVEEVGAPGSEFSSKPLWVSPSQHLANTSAPYLTRVATPAGEPLEHRPHTARRPALLIGLYVSYGLLQTLDAQSTIRALHSGTGHEGNPLVSPFAAHPAALATFKLGLTGGTIYGIDKLYKSHRRLGMITLALINSGYAYIVQRSYRTFPAR
jgi:hypothetical protein